jgi:hypothetical protein
VALVADSAVLEEIQYHLLEAPDLGVSWTDNLWTTAEVVGYANQRQQRFLKATSVLLGRARITNSGTISQTLPSDWAFTQRLVWVDDDGTWTELPRVDHRELDLSLSTWPTGTATKPQVYADTDTSTLTIHVAPIPTNGGYFQITYVPIAPALDGTGGGSIFMVPEEFTPAIKYGIMADMLGKNGRAHDPERAAYCESRFQEGIAAATAMVGGFI